MEAHSFFSIHVKVSYLFVVFYIILFSKALMEQGEVIAKTMDEFYYTLELKVSDQWHFRCLGYSNTFSLPWCSFSSSKIVREYNEVVIEQVRCQLKGLKANMFLFGVHVSLVQLVLHMILYYGMLT